MIEVLREKLNTTRAWRGPDIQDDSSWIMPLRATTSARSMRRCATCSRSASKFRSPPIEFPLPTLAAKLNDVPERMENGLGVVLIRGLPRDMYSHG